MKDRENKLNSLVRELWPVAKPMVATAFSLFMPVAIALFVGVLACVEASNDVQVYIMGLLLDSSTLFTIITVSVMNIVDFISGSTKPGSAIGVVFGVLVPSIVLLVAALMGSVVYLFENGLLEQWNRDFGFWIVGIDAFVLVLNSGVAGYARSTEDMVSRR